jgi:hypothetical protein
MGDLTVGETERLGLGEQFRTHGLQKSGEVRTTPAAVASGKVERTADLLIC